VELLPFAASIIPDRRLAKNRSAGRRLASERTFLAWIRTSLALLAGGIAVEAFTSDLFIAPVRKTVAVLLLLLAPVPAIGGQWWPQCGGLRGFPCQLRLAEPSA
jgi:uncharacterized membrane protein YidH (DUF202 family)